MSVFVSLFLEAVTKKCSHLSNKLIEEKSSASFQWENAALLNLTLCEGGSVMDSFWAAAFTVAVGCVADRPSAGQPVVWCVVACFGASVLQLEPHPDTLPLLQREWDGGHDFAPCLFINRMTDAAVTLGTTRQRPIRLWKLIEWFSPRAECVGRVDGFRGRTWETDSGQLQTAVLEEGAKGGVSVKVETFHCVFCDAVSGWRNELVWFLMEKISNVWKVKESYYIKNQIFFCYYCYYRDLRLKKNKSKSSGLSHIKRN